MKAAIVNLAGTEPQADLGRLTNGLKPAKEFADTGGDVIELIFDGFGTQWVPKHEDDDSRWHLTPSEADHEC